ncbi:unnamed protein product, partial [Didymodactylos carnosus]
SYKRRFPLAQEERSSVTDGDDDDVYTVDAKQYGCLSRFYNHSCSPNVMVQNVFIETHDIRFPWIALFAKDNIRAGEEIKRGQFDQQPQRHNSFTTTGTLSKTKKFVSSSTSLSSSQSTSDENESTSVQSNFTTKTRSNNIPETVRKKSTTMPTSFGLKQNDLFSINLNNHSNDNNNNHIVSTFTSNNNNNTKNSTKSKLIYRMMSLRRSSNKQLPIISAPFSTINTYSSPFPHSQIQSSSTPQPSSSISSTSSVRSAIYHVRTFDLTRDKHLRHYPCTIHFLDDTERTFYIDRHCKGIDLLNEVYNYLDLPERKYFGLLIEDLTQDTSYRWLDSLKTLKKQFNTTSPYHLYFKIRFFVLDPVKLEEEFTRYLYVLQIKKEILSGKLWCVRPKASLLASYLVQSELGDYDASQHHPGYVSDFRFIPFQNTEFEHDTEEYHKKHIGFNPAEAELNYLKVVSSLDMYGVELHKVCVKVPNTSDVNTVELYVGVSAVGLSVFQNSTKLNTFSWDRITKISFKRRTFYIQLVKNLNSQEGNSLVFTLRSYRSNKYLWISCVEHHKFFRLNTLPSSPRRFFPFANKFRHTNAGDSNSISFVDGKKRIETTQKKFERVSSRRSLRAAHTGLSSTLPVTSTTSTSLTSQNTKNNETIVFLSSSSISLQQSNNTDNQPPPKPPRQLILQVKNTKHPINHITSNETNTVLEANDYKPKNATLPRNSVHPSHLIQSSENKLTTNLNGTIGSSNTLTIKKFKSIQQPLENDLVLIKLIADNNERYGFNIKGGADQINPVIVSRVALNSPATNSVPPLNEGDQILSINNIDISNHTYEQIVNMIRQSRKKSNGELILIVRPNKFITSSQLNHDNQDIYDNELVSFHDYVRLDTLEESLQCLKNDLANGRLIEQYETLQRRRIGFTFDVSTSSENFHKNRYKDVLPYDQTRVILKHCNSADYINASFINIPITTTDVVNRYIAAQGPLSSTCDTFWKMIWQENCSLLVMLTTLYENGCIKCHQYWPNINEIFDYGTFTIKCRREKKENLLLYREFLFTHKEFNEERTIFQIQFETWADHGIPSDYSTFIDLVFQIRDLRRNKQVPVLVHCSAGIGRTGVLILMETALCFIESGQPIFPIDIVKQMRDQRMGMIQTTSQFQFVCNAVLYAYENGLVNVCS